MSVTGTVAVSAGLYVPFRGVSAQETAVGTWTARGTVVGDSGGGFAQINLLMSPQEFGFKPILIITGITATDQLATPIPVEFSFQAVGNERLSQPLLFLAPVGIVSAATNFSSLGGERLVVPIEPPTGGADNQIVFTATWRTNEDSDNYFMTLFGIMYDAESLARNIDWRPDTLFFGVR